MSVEEIESLKEEIAWMRRCISGLRNSCLAHPKEKVERAAIASSLEAMLSYLPRLPR